MNLDEEKHSPTVLKAAELLGREFNMFKNKEESEVKIRHEDWLENIKE
jgi:hypothetical protein